MKKLYHAKTSFVVKTVFSGLIWDLYKGPNAVYLTFDDGPTPGTTDKVLDILKKYDALATFFCKGSSVEKYPDLFNRIINEGHAVGNHTYSHIKGWYTKNQDYFNDVELANKFINSKLFRPPHGKISFRQIRYLKKSYQIIMWDIMSFDFDLNTSQNQCVDNVIKNVRAGSIVTFHDSEKASEKVQYSLPIVLDYITEKGYNLKFKIIDQINKTTD